MSVVFFQSFLIAKMAPSHVADHASFDATFEIVCFRETVVSS